MNAFSSVIGGLGLFFFGVWFLIENLKSLSGRRFRIAVVKWTKNSWTGFGLGTVLGASVQSMAAAIFVLVGLLSAGLISVRTAMPILAGANFGTSVLVFLTTLNIMVVMLFVLGLSGMSMVSERFARFKAYAGALFGISLLFLGINMLQTGAVTFVEQPWATELLESVRHSYSITFIAGGFIAVIAQSAAATSILVIALAGVGIFGFEQTVMAIYGANLGSGLVSLAMSWNLRGNLRQVAMFQILFLNVLGSLIFVGLFYLEVTFSIPLVKYLVSRISDNIEQQMAWVYLLLNTPGILFILLATPIHRSLQYFFPTTQSENDSEPHFIHDQAINAPSTALDLIKLEQQRLLGFFTRYFEIQRLNSSTEITTDTATKSLHSSFLAVANLVSELLDDLAGTNSADLIYERLNLSMNNQRVILMIESTLFDMVTTINAKPSNTELNELIDTLIETLDTVLLTLNDVVLEGRKFDKQLLKKMTGDRSAVLQEIRNNYFANNANINANDQLVLLKLTNLSERFFWLIGDLKMGREEYMFEK